VTFSPNQELKEWIDEINVKNDDYGVKALHIENNWDLELPPIGFTFIVENKYSDNVRRDTKEVGRLFMVRNQT